MVAKKPESTVPAGEFKTHVLQLLDRVARTGRGIVITKRGKPVARLEPLREPPSLEGSVIYEGDIISPIDETWESEA
jgi:prevent-host-death family protein